MYNKYDNKEIFDMLELELGKYYEEIIELDFGITFDEFLDWFVECGEDGCYYTNI